MMVKVASKKIEFDLEGLTRSILDPTYFPHAASEAWALCCKPLIADESDYHLPDKKTAVYIIGPEDAEICKIGISWDPNNRIQQLQTSHWAKLKLHALLWTGHRSALDIEKGCHKAAAEMGVRLKGEWVAMAPQEAAETVVKSARYFNANWMTSKQFTDWANAEREAMIDERVQENKARRRSENEEKCRRLGW